MQQKLDWEQALVATISEELAQLRYLVEDKSGATETGDIHSQLARLCGLTDLASNGALPFNSSTRLQLQELNEAAMAMIRDTTALTSPNADQLQDFERDAALGLFNAIALNLPYLATAETSQYAITLSLEAFASLRKHMGTHPDFEVMERLVRVQDFRVMKLAGDNR